MLHVAGALEDHAGIEAAAEAFLASPWATMRRALLGIPASVAGPALEGDQLVFSAMKPTEDGRGVVLRCYNPMARAAGGTWRVPWTVRRALLCRLDETALEPVSAVNGRIACRVPTRGVLTIVSG
jgi:alpha-mannosidase